MSLGGDLSQWAALLPSSPILHHWVIGEGHRDREICGGIWRGNRDFQSVEEEVVGRASDCRIAPKHKALSLPSSAAEKPKSVRQFPHWKRSWRCWTS